MRTSAFLWTAHCCLKVKSKPCATRPVRSWRARIMSLRYTCTHMVSEDNLVEVSEDNGIAVRVLCIHTHTHTHTHTSALSLSLSLARARAHSQTHIPSLKHIFLLSHSRSLCQCRTLSSLSPPTVWTGPPTQYAGMMMICVCVSVCTNTGRHTRDSMRGRRVRVCECV